MLQDQEGLFSVDTPLVFADGKKFYDKFSEEFIVHKKGYFILGGSGVGKSYYYRNQKPGEKHWVDADVLWRKARAMPIGAWWEEGVDTMDRIEQQCDIITAQAKMRGLWMLGSSNCWLKPDAVVIPNFNTHVKFLKIRYQNYDGGAKSDNLAPVIRERKYNMRWIKQGVPKFGSIDEAIKYIEELYKKESK
jgi:hypothetical protein